MGGNSGEIQIGSKRELYNKYINHYAGASTKKACSKIISVQMYNILGIGVQQQRVKIG